MKKAREKWLIKGRRDNKRQEYHHKRKGYEHNFDMIRNKQGELAMNTKERTEIWKEYFDKLLNTEEP